MKCLALNMYEVRKFWLQGQLTYILYVALALVMISRHLALRIAIILNILIIPCLNTDLYNQGCCHCILAL